MANWIWRSKKENDEGFSLVELLIVVIIMGILAAIAIPLFLSQRAKAEDAKSLADVETMGKEISTWYVDHTAAPVIVITGTAPDRVWRLKEKATDADSNDNLVGPVGKNVAADDSGATDATLWGFKGTGKTEWCFWAANKHGKVKGYYITAVTTIKESSTKPTACT
ncbi:MAG: prepilin-type N-terminal cleavage/methylation domain-containing protein [Bifidobacteriaceae bacterium]|jgi:prepilin-type N-terminal cleavage/methylation domain-containing protein|nr:prepilin-type N-terminal cleavage/methylation domain-containing protein [Bifidobacteriaceae bacterium]